tara:strand:+ start:164 stop:367 length:204 start_codon:yes stop_codon:yes gene_type:complete
MAYIPPAIMPKVARILNRFNVLDFMYKNLGLSNIQKIRIFFLFVCVFKTGKDYICAHFKRINVHYYG